MNDGPMPRSEKVGDEPGGGVVVSAQISARPYGVSPPGFRLPEATRLGPVRLQVSDLGRSIEYYEDVIGLRAERVAADTAALTARDDDKLLISLHSRPNVTPARRGAFGLYHFAILLPERAALGRFAAHVSTRRIPTGMADHLVSEALYLSDPDDLGIEVYADRPRTAWQHQDRELVMGSDRLDIADLIAAGNGGTWRGLPKNTTIGHVHLHVGNLEEADAFYHRALGFDKTVWSYPGALFFGAGGYHHHLGTNVWSPGPAPAADQARLLEWELVVPLPDDVVSVARSISATGRTLDDSGPGVRITDPWGTDVRIRRDE